MKKTLSLALALLSVSIGLAGSASAATGSLSSQDKEYLQSIQCDPEAPWITSLKAPQIKALHAIIAKNTDAATKQAEVNKFLDSAVAQYLLSLGNTSISQA